MRSQVPQLREGLRFVPSGARGLADDASVHRAVFGYLVADPHGIGTAVLDLGVERR